MKQLLVGIVLAISLMAVLVLGYPSVDYDEGDDGTHVSREVLDSVVEFSGQRLHSLAKRSPQAPAPNQGINWDGIFNIPIAALQAVNQLLSNNTKSNNGR